MINKPPIKRAHHSRERDLTRQIKYLDKKLMQVNKSTPELTKQKGFKTIVSIKPPVAP